nr:hypothetical protein [Tanacetum cinerariifolium]
MVVQILLWYLDSGCSKHKTEDRSQLTNFVHKFLGTLKFGNDQIAKIIGYGDYQIGNITISRVYYVEGLGHNLFSVGQFCDSDLEVALKKHMCFVRNLEGFDLLSRSLETNLYTLSLRDMMAKQSHKPKSKDTNKEKLYLFLMDLCGPMRITSINRKKYILVIVDDYSQFTWVKFLASKNEAPDFIIKFLKMIQVRLNTPVRNIHTDNGTEFVNQTLRSYYESVGISHETSVERSPKQNGVVERKNHTLVEAARTMYQFIKEQVENGVIKLYFINMEYQLADLFTKDLGRDRIEFLINKLGMRSFTLETRKQLTNEVDENWWMDDLNITIEEYIRLEEEKLKNVRKCLTDHKIWYDEDVHDLISVETEFLAIVFNDNLTSNETPNCEPTVSSLNNNEIDFRISFDEFDDEDYTVVFGKNSFSYKIISTNDLKTDSENDNEKVNKPLLPSPEPTNLYVPFGIPFDPKRYYKYGDCTRMLQRPSVSSYEYVVSTLRTECLKVYKLCTILVNFANMAPLPPRDQRHVWLRYQVEGYTEEIVYDFEQRLETIFGRQVNRVHILDFEGLTPNMRVSSEMGLDVADTLAHYLFKHAEGRKSGARLSGVYFIRRLTHHFGLVGDDGLRGLFVMTREIPLIDMVDEGAQADPAPPLAAGRTMPYRLGRLDEAMQGL